MMVMTDGVRGIVMVMVCNQCAYGNGDGGSEVMVGVRLSRIVMVMGWVHTHLFEF